MRAFSQCLSILTPLDARRRLLPLLLLLLRSHENECRIRMRYRLSTRLHLETTSPAEHHRNRHTGNYCARTVRLPRGRTQQSAIRVCLSTLPVKRNLVLTSHIKRRVARKSAWHPAKPRRLQLPLLQLVVRRTGRNARNRKLWTPALLPSHGAMASNYRRCPKRRRLALKATWPRRTSLLAWCRQSTTTTRNTSLTER
jgi:hypothetical protein